MHPPPVRPAELAGTLWARSRAQTGNRQPADSSPAPESELAALCAWLEAQGLVEGWPPLAQAAAAVYFCAAARSEPIALDSLAMAAGLSAQALPKRLAALEGRIAALAAKLLPGLGNARQKSMINIATLMRLTSALDKAGAPSARKRGDRAVDSSSLAKRPRA